jgi:hypothetical protein
VDSLRIGTRSHSKSHDESPLKLFFEGFRGDYEGVFFGVKPDYLTSLSLPLDDFSDYHRKLAGC